MKIVVILGGLGSQMFKYAFYLRVKERYGREDNGYGLTVIFNIRESDFVQFLTSDDYWVLLVA